jgi:hypothetical protein
MGRSYAINGAQAVASPTDTVLGLTSVTTVRPEVFYLDFGSLAAPTDVTLQWILQRYTAAGAGDAVTPTALDPDDPAALASALANHGTEPTYTAGEVLLDVPVFQRANHQWWALDKESRFKLPAVAANGVGLQPVHASFTGLVGATLHYEE